MKFSLLALDYDGTIAERGELDPEVRRVLSEVRRRDVTVVLVTGRILGDLLRHLRGLELFDAVVAENGAVLHFPRTGRSTLLARPPDPGFVAELARRNVPFLAGECVVELDAAHAAAALAAIRELEQPLVLLFNRDRLMVLPQATSKATGLREAARALRVSLHNALAVGDAENDHDLLAACEVGVAVAWGSAALRRAADEVLQGDGPRDVARFVRQVTERPLLPKLTDDRRRSLHLGLGAGGEPVSIALHGSNALIAGAPQTGKSWVAGLLCEQLILQNYCACVIDPEGDYATLEGLPGVIVLGCDGEPPSLAQVEATLRYPDVSVVLDLCKLPAQRKRPFVTTLLARIADLRRRTGLPHRVVIDEAHYFLHEPDVDELLDLDRGGFVLITYRVSQLHPDVLGKMQAVIVTGESERAEAEALQRYNGREGDGAQLLGTLRALELDEALLLPGASAGGGALQRFRIARRLTPHVRHRHKYLEVPVPEGSAFEFRHDGVPTGQRACSLQELIDALAAAPDHTFDKHLELGDLSRWIGDVFADAELAEDVRDVEADWRAGRIDRPHDRLVRAIRARYSEASRDPVAPGPELHLASG